MLSTLREWNAKILGAFKQLKMLIYDYYTPCRRITYHYRVVE